jgi:hypothetical protein
MDNFLKGLKAGQGSSAVFLNFDLAKAAERIGYPKYSANREKETGGAPVARDDKTDTKNRA